MDKNPDDAGLREWKTYRSCGILLSLMSIALSVAVLLLVAGDGAKSYPGMMIYFMAAYTFYKLIFSIVHMKKARRERSLLSITLRNINHCEALVTLLSLQSAMFTAFSGSTDTFVPYMNAVTGGTVCLISLCLGLVMVYNAYKERPCTGHEED